MLLILRSSDPGGAPGPEKVIALHHQNADGKLKQLEAENARLKKLVAERDLEIEVMKEVEAKNCWAPAAASSCVWPGAWSLGTTGLHTVLIIRIGCLVSPAHPATEAIEHQL